MTHHATTQVTSHAIVPSLAQPIYNTVAVWYSDHIQHQHALKESVYPAHESVVPAMLAMLPSLSNADVLDICCGTGIFTRALVAKGATRVTGVDLAARLIEKAQSSISPVTTANKDLFPMPNITYIVDDATWLLSQPSSSYDIVTCCLGLTDVPNLIRIYQATYRVLRAGGVAIFSVIHPAAPCSTSDGGLDYLPVAYHEEHIYTTKNEKSVRGRVPTYHRPLSQYLSCARQTGLHLADLAETRAPDALLHQQPLYDHVPYGLVLKFQKLGANA